MGSRTASFRRLIVMAVVLAVGFTTIGSAQEPPPTAAGQEDQKVAKDAKPRQGAQGSTPSFAEGIITNVRNKVGLALNFSEGYGSNPYNYNDNSLSFARPATYSVMSGNIFFNFQKKDTQFHFDYGGGYFYYNGQGHGMLNGHNLGLGQFNYSFKISRRSALRLADSLQLTYTDGPIPLSQDAPQLQIQAAFGQEVALQRQRFISNSLGASYNYQLSRKSDLDVFTNYRFYLYGLDKQSNTNGVSVGASYSYQLKKWLSLGGSYSVYLQKPDSGFNKANINRALVGPFTFQLRPTVHLFASGGMEFARQNGQNYQVASFQGGISKTGPTTGLSFGYHRGLSAVIGSGGLMQSDSVSANVVQRLTKRINAQVSTAYFKGSLFQSGPSNIPYGSGRNLIAQAGLEFSLRSNLVASLSYYYLDQLARNLALNWPRVTRYNASFRIQYFLATLHRL
jgi:hypothetical protein